MVDVNQKRARPLGKDRQINPNNNGIIHSIIRLCVACRGSAAGGVVIFCCTHMATPTRMARAVSGDARFSQRKLFSRGSMEYTVGQE